MNLTAKDAIAGLVLVGCFGLLAIYVGRGETPPDVVLLIISGSVSGVLAYYFGAHNGNITGLAASAVQISQMAAQLAAQAIEKRAAPAATSVVVNPPAPAATPGGETSGQA